MKNRIDKKLKRKKRINRKEMIIGLDAKRAVANHTGLGNYSRFMVDILATYHEGHNYRLFIPKKKKNSSYDHDEEILVSLAFIFYQKRPFE